MTKEKQMSTPNDGGPAFPTNEWKHPNDSRGDIFPASGMSLRAYFAGQAMTGIIINEEAYLNPSMAAKWAVEFADSLIAELNKPTT